MQGDCDDARSSKDVPASRAEPAARCYAARFAECGSPTRSRCVYGELWLGLLPQACMYCLSHAFSPLLKTSGTHESNSAGWPVRLLLCNQHTCNPCGIACMQVSLCSCHSVSGPGAGCLGADTFALSQEQTILQSQGQTILHNCRTCVNAG